MKTFVKTFRGKISYKKIDKYVDLVRRTLDPDDYFDIEFQYDDDWQFIKIKFGIEFCINAKKRFL